ncbi:MAG TPA: methylated-DNA--[protein]-cysteine S-methyltransferase [Terracidiphilus sp.]|jgi:methylated-DNA-[protein]-cysteine S-methyltransferase
MNGILSLWVDRLPTPLGEMLIVSDDAGCLRATFWSEKDRLMQPFLKRHYAPMQLRLAPARDPHGLTTAIARYFDGDVHSIDSLSVKTAGTDFQRLVWRALRNIPCGRTISYGELARRIGRPQAVRAVGLANGANPLGVVVPCHRVIGANGSLTGYGGGMERKRWLLDHETRLRLPLVYT